jgi:hypothetical protein
MVLGIEHMNSNQHLSLDAALAGVIGDGGSPNPSACLDGIAGATSGTRMFKDMAASEYHADRDALSCSLMKPLLTSPAHFQASLAVCGTSSRAKDFGSALHVLLLQPELAGQELAVFHGNADGRKKEYQEFLLANCEKLVLDEPTFALARQVVEKIRRTMFKGRPLGKFIDESIPEATIYFTEPTTGLRMRVRVDAYHPELNFDLKSTRHGAVNLFARDAVDLHYDLQAFMYSLARAMFEGTTSARPFVFIATETTAPHSVSTLTAGENFMANGLRKFQSCAATFKACTEAGLWPDLGRDDVLEIEPWQQFSDKQGWRQALAVS